VSLSLAPDMSAGRLAAADYAQRFADATPRLTPPQALLEAERCLYCFDAPCANACPTHIDVPSFIRRITDGNLRGSAKAILEANPLGGMCARVCPTENLCEAVCVRHTQEDRPVSIGRLQRFAVDALMDSTRPQLFTRAPSTGKRVAVVGAGPAGLACAHSLARLGHELTMFDAKPKAGGLNEYGLASYKTPNNFAQAEVKWLLGVGGITLQHNWKLETVSQLDVLRKDFDALFLGMGLPNTHQLGVPGEALQGVQDAVDFIAALRQAEDLSTLPVGRQVVVIGGGMTAVDAAVQSKLLGAQEVHMVYRRGPEVMSASRAEQEWAQTHGVVIHHYLAPVEVLTNRLDPQWVGAVSFVRQKMDKGGLVATGETVVIEADMVLKAIGQKLGNPLLAQAGFALASGRLTVEAVEHGKQSAHAIHQHLMNA
jgi:dihydropyrimidine dehydrogenase (NAD+) subunit PreT